MVKSPVWFALYVRPRHEFVVLSDLSSNGTEAYLPVAKKLRNWKNRKKLVEFPLFPGYLFARVHPVSEQILALLKTKGVVRILSTVPGQPTQIADAEILALQALLASDKELNIHPELQEGRVVRIKRGIFHGVEGVVSKTGDSYFLHVNIAMLGRSVAVKLLSDDVEVVH